MNKDELIRKAMSELGRKSAEARKKKYGKNYMQELIQKGATARRGSKKGTAKVSERLEGEKKQTKPKWKLNMPYTVE